MTLTFSVVGSFYLHIPGGYRSDGFSPVIRAIRCNHRSAGDRWLMAFSALYSAAAATFPADGSSPIFAPLLLPGNYISEDTFPDGRSANTALGLAFVVSSTADTLTKDVAAVVDISVDIDVYEPAMPVLATSAGDATTAIKTLQVWAEASGPKTLHRIDVRNTSGLAIYLQLFAKDSPSEGAVPLVSWPLAVGVTPIIHLGNQGGRSPYAQDADGTARKGCTLVFSSTQNTKTVVAANAGMLLAYYI